MFKRIKLLLKSMICCSKGTDIVDRQTNHYYDDHYEDYGDQVQVINNSEKVIFYIHIEDLCNKCKDHISSSRSSSIKGN